MIEGEQGISKIGPPAGEFSGMADSAGVIRPPRNATCGGPKPLCISFGFTSYI